MQFIWRRRRRLRRHISGSCIEHDLIRVQFSRRIEIDFPNCRMRFAKKTRQKTYTENGVISLFLTLPHSLSLYHSLYLSPSEFTLVAQRPCPAMEGET